MGEKNIFDVKMFLSGHFSYQINFQFQKTTKSIKQAKSNLKS